jgi:hypothetical protein
MEISHCSRREDLELFFELPEMDLANQLGQPEAIKAYAN